MDKLTFSLLSLLVVTQKVLRTLDILSKISEDFVNLYII